MWEKILEYVALIVIILSIVIKAVLGVDDTGILVVCSFLAIMLYVIFLVCAFFPADWRMTDKQKAKIKDMNVYQMRYRKIFVVINFSIAIISSSLIILL